jgi:hypothetical protein
VASVLQRGRQPHRPPDLRAAQKEPATGSQGGSKLMGDSQRGAERNPRLIGSLLLALGQAMQRVRQSLADFRLAPKAAK